MYMSATLGGLIKDLRVQKNISQMEIAFALGWLEPSRLSRIEQGKVVNPPRFFIDQLSLIMKLEDEEKNQLLLAGNYLPNAAEIALIIKDMDPFLDRWPYPALLFDFSWRIVSKNLAFSEIHHLENKKTKHEHILENLFDLNYPQNKYLKGNELQKWHEYLTKLLAQFQYLQKTRTKEKWYIDLIKKLMGNSLFRELWPKALLTKEMELIGNFGYKTVILTTNKQERQNYYFFVMPVIKDSRFQVELYMPAK